MNKKTRTQNSVRNMTVGISLHLLTALFSFVSRTVFVRVLGVQYLGISGLFSNILTMLALSDLGIYTVMVYSLYKPLADGDEVRIAALVHFFQRLYNIVALIVLGLGVACIPLFPLLINNSSLTYEQTVTYYVLLLLNSVCSYFAISKSTLLQADQQVHIVQIIRTICTFGLQVVQIVILMLTHKYVLFLIVQILFTLGGNVTLSRIASKRYPYIRKGSTEKVSKELKFEIVKNLKATLLYKVGNTIMNSTDNILISVIVGTTVVGYYSNYVTIFTMVNAFVMIAIQAILPSVGNYYLSQSPKKKYERFRFLQFGFYALATLWGSCYICGMNDFVRIWLGEEYLLTDSFVWALAFYRFIFCAIHPLWMTRESTGLFVSMRYVMLCASGVNIVLSVVLGCLIGVTGIILATAISILVTTFWYEPKQLCKCVFGISQVNYWTDCIKLLVPSAVSLLVSLVMQTLHTSSIVILLLKFLACGIVTLLSFYFFMGRSEEFARTKMLITGIIKKKISGGKING